MKRTLLTCLFYYLFSCPLYAYPSAFSLPWLAPMLLDDASSWSTESLTEMNGLFDCGELPKMQYCSAPVKYYKTEIESYVWIKDGKVNQVELFAPFTPLSYSELQLNLRKDGFVLAWVKIGQASIDIIEALKHKPLYKVDREVVMFMNEGAISTPRQLIWYRKSEYYASQQSRYVEFLSDGETVTIRFMRGDHHLEAH